jgi:dolichol-phosphate mannosyltransferase
MDRKTLIFIPTYNELENVEKIFSEILKLKLDADLLFLDDNSPDGTGQLIDKLVQKHPNEAFVIHRQGKLGIGSAHKVGIRWAYEKKYDTLITMDCDFTHSPEYILDFIKHKQKASIIIGSRYIQKDSLTQWNLFRKFLTYLGHFLTVRLLNMPYDASGAFRLYQLDKIPQKTFDLIESNSYSFFFESLFVLNLNNNSIFEFSIRLPSRTYGHSKMSIKDVFKSFNLLLKIFLKKIFNKKAFIYNS